MVLKAIRRLKLPPLIDPKPSRQRDLVPAMMVRRLLHPVSKLGTRRLWHTTTLAGGFSLEDAGQDDQYGAMGWLLQRQNRIEKNRARQHGRPGHGPGPISEVTPPVRVEAGGAGGVPGPADRDSDQASEKPSGSGLDLRLAPHGHPRTAG